MGYYLAPFGLCALSLAACRYAGQVGNLRGGWLPPPARSERAGHPAKLPHKVSVSQAEAEARAPLPDGCVAARRRPGAGLVPGEERRYPDQRKTQRLAGRATGPARYHRQMTPGTRVGA